MNQEPSNHRGVTVAVRGLRKSYRDNDVLKGLDFDVRSGEIFVIMGPSGSGKNPMPAKS
jgi:ABC-type multidrug transport system ATPase subunit